MKEASAGLAGILLERHGDFANKAAGPQDALTEDGKTGQGDRRTEHGNSVTHLLLHDGHGGPCQQEGLEGHQVPERVMHLIMAGDDVSPGLADGAEENSPGGRGRRKTGCRHPGGQIHGITSRSHV